jgi:hypothetical protein
MLATADTEDEIKISFDRIVHQADEFEERLNGQQLEMSVMQGIPRHQYSSSQTPQPKYALRPEPIYIGNFRQS